MKELKIYHSSTKKLIWGLLFLIIGIVFVSRIFDGVRHERYLAIIISSVLALTTLGSSALFFWGFWISLSLRRKNRPYIIINDEGFVVDDEDKINKFKFSDINEIKLVESKDDIDYIRIEYFDNSNESSDEKGIPNSEQATQGPSQVYKLEINSLSKSPDTIYNEIKTRWREIRRKR